MGITVKLCPNQDCRHLPAKYHDKSGCKLCDCKLDEYGNSRVGFEPLRLDSGQRNKPKQMARYVRIAFRGVVIAMLAVIVFGNANLQTLSYFVTQEPMQNATQNEIEQEKRIQALLGIQTLTVLFGIIGIFFSEWGNWMSNQELADRIRRIERQLRRGS
jgi:hypothetical protein